MPAAGATELLLMERVDGLASDVNRLVREVEALKRPPSESPGEYQMHESGIPPKEEAQPHSAKKKAG
ncbi:MAG: hypothetical protein JOZ69_23755 [Myxococcales bacterium]|nr:hypothetical protein [Myxococcales bacterium]